MIPSLRLIRTKLPATIRLYTSLLSVVEHERSAAKTAATQPTRCDHLEDSALDNNSAMESFSRTWDVPNEGSDLIARKKVDWSVFLYGSHIPLHLHARFAQANGGKHIARGQKEPLTLVVEGHPYRATIVNAVRNAVSDSLQIRWDSNWKLRSLLQQVFRSSFNYLSERKSDKRKAADVPDGEAEYIDFIDTGTPFVYLLSLRTAAAVGEGSDLAEADSDGALADVTERISLEGKPTHVRVEESQLDSEAKSLFQVVLDNLTSKVCGALLECGVRDMQGFLAIGREEQRGLRSSGADRATISEILTSQSLVKCFAIRYHERLRHVTPQELQSWLDSSRLSSAGPRGTETLLPGGAQGEGGDQRVSNVNRNVAATARPVGRPVRDGECEELFEVVLDSLSPRAREAVLQSWICDLAGLMAFEPRRLAAFGVRIVEEIRKVRREVKLFLLQQERQHLTAGRADLLAWLVERGAVSVELPKSDAPDSSDTATDALSRSRDSTQDASVEAHVNACTTDTDRDQTLYGVLLDCLSTRSANVLRNNRVRDVRRFLELSEEVVLGFRCAGSKTVREILKFQERMRSVLTEFDEADGGVPLSTLVRMLTLVQPRARALLRSVPTPITVQADDPAPWSVLHKTLPDALGIEERMRLHVWDSAESLRIDEIDFNSDDRRRLAAVAIYDQDTVDVLLCVSLWFLLNSGISQHAFDQAVSAVRSCVPNVDWSLACDTASDAPQPQPILSEDDLDPVAGLRIDTCGVPQRAVEAAVAMGAYHWGDLLAVTEQKVCEQHGLCVQSLEIIRGLWGLKPHATAAVEKVNRGLSRDAYNSFDVMMHSLVQRIAKNPQEDLVLRGRLGCGDGHLAKLDELASQLNVTRARVSQITRRRLDALRGSPEILSKFWLSVKSVLDDHGGICSVRDMGRDLSRLLGWQSAPRLRPLLTILELGDFVTVEEKGGYVCRTDLKCRECEAATGMLQAMLTDGDEMHVMDAAARLSMACNQVCFDRNGGAHISPALVTMIASRSDSIISEGSKILTKDAWDRLYGRSLRVVVRSVLEESGHPLHYSEIAERIRKTNLKYGTVKNSQVHTVLSNGICPEFKIAGRGTYGLSLWEIKQYKSHAEAVIELLGQFGEPMRGEHIVERLARNGEYKPGNIRVALTSHPKIVKVGQDTFDLADRLSKQSVAQEAEDIVIAIGDIDDDVWKL